MKSSVLRSSDQGCRLSSVVRRPAFAKATVGRLASGFTLVELMVVVAIISILLMLLIPNIRAMREKAWSSYCQNNLRQYGIAMNQYMADYSGYFIYPGFGVGGAVDGSGIAGSDIGDFEGLHDGRAVGGASVGGAASDSWGHFVSAYVGPNVTLEGLSAGAPSVRVCPVILRELHNANYFDPRSPGFKGYGTYVDYYTKDLREFGDFESSSGAGYDDAGNLSSNYTLTFLDAAFTTYALNPMKYRQASSNCPASVIAFIDWNAREGWNANLSGSTWSAWYIAACCISVSDLWMFNGTNAAGVAIDQGSPKWTNAWWLTEVGFHHLQGNVYGANYVAMDGHVGWISSNTISVTNFTTGL
ncbi:MAG: DUF1559 domain-containing protein [Verrucomicrobia bacterium]|nr:DUF1559 domain-containing protein [Verrucomicrobiota bacterium]